MRNLDLFDMRSRTQRDLSLVPHSGILANVRLAPTVAKSQWHSG
jgi:hypothetical protein